MFEPGDSLRFNEIWLKDLPAISIRNNNSEIEWQVPMEDFSEIIFLGNSKNILMNVHSLDCLILFKNRTPLKGWLLKAWFEEREVINSL